MILALSSHFFEHVRDFVYRHVWEHLDSVRPAKKTINCLLSTETPEQFRLFEGLSLVGTQFRRYS